MEETICPECLGHGEACHAHERQHLSKEHARMVRDLVDDLRSGDTPYVIGQRLVTLAQAIEKGAK